MAQTQRNGLAGLRIDGKSFHHLQRSGWSGDGRDKRTAVGEGDGVEGDRTTISQDYDAHRRGTDEDSSVLNDLHSATPPISVPRPGDQPTSEYLDFPHKPEEVQASPFDSFLHHRRRSISINAEANIESGRHHSLEEPLHSTEAKARVSLKPRLRTSGLRHAFSQDRYACDNRENYAWVSSPRRPQNQRFLPTGYSRTSCLASPEDDVSIGSDLERFTSLASLSTASPLNEEPQTPPQSASEHLMSPFCAVSPTQQSALLEGHNSWSAGAITPFGSKPRSRYGSLRGTSRRSTASSGKSPASTFLSMWNGQDEHASQPDDEGQMVGTDYVLGKQIGFGGFSTVKEAYKVEGTGETRRLAVKIVRKHVTGKSERENDQVQAEFDHEVRVWRYLNHSHVLALDAVYETDYATFCFTKLAIGGTLFDLIRQNRQGLELTLAKKYTYQLACALRYLHEDARVVHRDIKLENCLLDPVTAADGTKSSNLVLCDFGMAEWMTTDNGCSSLDPYENAADRPPPKTIGPSDTSTSIAGSLEYASPELLSSTSSIIHPAVDIWAFGVIVFTIVVGSRPFQDPFAPRIQSNILSGNWDHSAVLGDTEDPEVRQGRKAALELIKGCLEMEVDRRWTIRRILASEWLRGHAENPDDNPSNTVWRL
ncbi:hypothetical protein ASPZODRAFT_128347 [Penicilliopsis zonata CBS 506.65]|uniref:Protein kinase domain-containing protein n=1 Tax=Penicilliopsis zonata CBS 506.65 TaxID=1073090 RepID=A0A1L9SRS1_9EURO|nr:hypothetical protein ASPZODRAFT_128347 [Penicilliopsis zonata CBS 506.65]OJJ49816.1 hypothetical protein ASPZODRAFT_128347 [Penicilliopsis zonata CBS 506.65]